MANWSDLHDDLLVLIAKRIHYIEDYVAFGIVCQSWRMAATKQNFNSCKFRQIPWLMLSNDDKDSTFRDFYSLSHQRIHRLRLPESNGNRCFSSQGWIFTVGKDEEVNLLHPLSRSKITLPNLRTFPNLDESEVVDMQSFFIHKVVLSASPCSTSDYVVMVLHGGYTKLAFYKPGDGVWISTDTRFAMYFDVIYYKERFYAVDCVGRVLVCDVNGSNPTKAEIFSVLPAGYVNNLIEKLYLVESLSGKLLMVSRKGSELRYVTEGSSDMTYGTTRFQVFELDERNVKNWKEVNYIGDEALILGDNSSFAIGVSDHIKANCIYFSDDCAESYHDTDDIPNGGGKDMGVYNLSDGSIEPHFKGESYSLISPPLWVVPTF